MGEPDKPDIIQDQTLVTNNEAEKNQRLNGFQTGKATRDVSRDVIPANFIQAIEGSKRSTDTLTATYTTSINFLINAGKDVQQLSKQGQTQNASLIKSIQITQGKFEEVNLKTTNTLLLLVAKNSKEVKEQKPKTERSYKEFLLNDTFEGQLVSKVMGAFKDKDPKKTDSDVDDDTDIETGAEAQFIPPLQPVKVMEYGDEALRQLCRLFKNCINIKSTSTGRNGCVDLCDKPGSILDKILSGLGLLSVARAVAPALSAAAVAAALATAAAAAMGTTAVLQLLNSTIDNAVIKTVLNKSGEWLKKLNPYAAPQTTGAPGIVVIPATPAVPVNNPLPVQTTTTGVPAPAPLPRFAPGILPPVFAPGIPPPVFAPAPLPRFAPAPPLVFAPAPPPGFAPAPPPRFAPAPPPGFAPAPPPGFAPAPPPGFAPAPPPVFAPKPDTLTVNPPGKIIPFPEIAEPLRKAAYTIAQYAVITAGIAAAVALLPEIAVAAGAVTAFRAAAVAVPLLIAASKSSAATINQLADVASATPKAKSTDEFTNFSTPKSIPSFNNNIPISSDKATSLQYAAASVRGENFTSDSNMLLGDRFGNNAQALPVPAPISLILPVTSTESSINPNIIELTDTMKGLTAAFAKQAPNTEAGGTTNISTNNSSVSNTSSSFGGGAERDVIYMDRNKTRNQNAYRGELF